MTYETENQRICSRIVHELLHEWENKKKTSFLYVTFAHHIKLLFTRPPINKIFLE